MLFFELLQIAIGNRERLSHAPTTEEWRELYALAQKQALVGIAFRGVEQLPTEQRPPRALLMQWYMATERIKVLNEEMDQKALAVANKFLEEGFPGVVLKGQGVAQLYKVERSTVKRQQTTGCPPDEDLNLTQNSQTDTEISCNADNISQHESDTNLDALTHAQACAGHQGNENDNEKTAALNGDDNENVDVTPSASLVPLKEGQCTKLSTLNTQQNYLTQNSQKSQNNISSHDNQQNIDLNSQKTASSDSQSAALPNAYVPDGKFSIFNFQFSISNYRTPGDIDIWLHGERSAILEYVRRCVPDCKPVYHHVDFPVVSDVSIEVHFTPTWMNSPVRNRCLQRFFKSMVNSLFNQRDKHTNLDASTHTQACAGHPDEGFGLTQKAQKAQNLHDASPVPSGVIACSDHELHGLHEYSGASETKIISHGCSRIDTDSRIASLACGHPDEDTQGAELNVECLMFNEGSQRLSENGPHPNLLQGERGLGLPDEGFDLTQKSQKRSSLAEGKSNTQKIISEQGCQRADTNSQKRSSLAEGKSNARIASLACGHPDGTVDRRPLTVDTCLDSKQATLPTPNNAFNRIYILVHIYRHLFAEGIGLKQLLDYYFVLQQGFTEVEREETLRTLRSLGMMRFTRAVMWVLQEVYGLPDRYLLTSPDEEEGRFLLSEILLAGNFGQHDERLQRAEGEGTFRWGLRKVMRNFRFVRSYPSEVLWSPLFKVWHLFWRMGHA